MALSDAERQAVQSLSTAVRATLVAKYGDSVDVGSVRLVADGDGKVSGLMVSFSYTVKDVGPDKTSIRQDGSVDIW